MAVQAQYPSNIHLLNRNTQEGKNTIANEYSLHQQIGGAGGNSSTFLDHQPHILLNSGAGNTNKKRSRESMAWQQSQPSNQLINLSLLHTPQNHPNNVVSTGLRLSFGDQLQHQKQQHPLHHQTQQHQLSLFSSQTSQDSSVFSPFLSNDLNSHINQQRQEIDNFITFQGEELRRGLVEKRQRNFRSLLSAAEESVAMKLKEKEAEVENAFRLNAELEARAAQLGAEAQAWQARAREHEVIRAGLQAQIQMVMGLGGAGCNVERDEWGYGGGSGSLVAAAAAEDEESVFVDPDRVIELDGPSCKGCGRRVASMVLMPCRHLCLCMECDSVARCCPLCYTFRSSSVEVIMG